MQHKGKQYTESCLNDAQCEEDAACFFFFFLPFPDDSNAHQAVSQQASIFGARKPPQGRHLLVRGGVFLFLGVLRPRVTSGPPVLNTKKKMFLKSLFPPFNGLIFLQRSYERIQHLVFRVQTQRKTTCFQKQNNTHLFLCVGQQIGTEINKKSRFL